MQMSGKHPAVSLQLVGGELDLPVACVPRSPRRVCDRRCAITSPYQIPAQPRRPFRQLARFGAPSKGRRAPPICAPVGPMFPTQPSVASGRVSPVPWRRATSLTRFRFVSPMASGARRAGTVRPRRSRRSRSPRWVARSTWERRGVIRPGTARTGAGRIGVRDPE